MLSLGKGAGEGIIGTFQRLNQALAIRSPLGFGNFGPPRRKPLHLLQFHPFPGGITNNGIKAAAVVIPCPIAPEPWKSYLPVKEPLLDHQALNLFQQGGCFRMYVVLIQGKINEIAKYTHENFLPGDFIRLLAQIQPLQAMHKRQERSEGRRGLLQLGKEAGGVAGLLDFRIAQLLDGLHIFGSFCSFAERFRQQRGAASGLGLLTGLLNPAAEKAVTATQMMIQKTQRRARGKGVQPEGDLGQFHRHGILVHTVDTTLQHQAPHNVAVIQLAFLQLPTATVGILPDGGANRLNALRHRRRCPVRPWGAVGLCLLILRGGGHGLDHPITEIVHQTHQEVAGAHGRIADFERQDLLRAATLHQGRQGLLDDEPHQ